MKVVYIAGPFTGRTAWDIESNIRQSETVALNVAYAGAMPLCPHTNTRFFHGQLTAEFWYEGTLELLRRCDAIFLHNWENSAGSIRERNLAIEIGMPIFESLEELEG